MDIVLDSDEINGLWYSIKAYGGARENSLEKSRIIKLQLYRLAANSKYGKIKLLAEYDEKWILKPRSKQAKEAVRMLLEKFKCFKEQTNGD